MLVEPMPPPFLRACLLLVPLLFACAPTPGADRAGHGVLLIAVDALRADHLPSGGYDRRTMPRVEQLISEGAYFEHTFAAAPQRIPSHAALLSGSDPNLARRKAPQWLEASLEQPWYLPPAVPRLGVEFLVGGAATAAFVDHADVSAAYGFAAGFQTFEGPPQGADASHGAERLVTRTLNWVRTLGRDRDWFAYVHFADLDRTWRTPDPRWDTYFEPRPELDAVPPVGTSEPSLFAIPPARFFGGVLTLGQYEARYDGALRRLDTELHRLLEELDAAGRLEHTTIALVGTFGVQFGEAGLMLDAGRLSLADLAVPFVLRPAPARFGAFDGRRIGGIASLMDVAPTLIDAAGLTVPRTMQGLTLWPAARDNAPSPRRHAFASCGIQSGYAAFNATQAIEVLLFGEGARASLVSGWFGDLERRSNWTEERLYDWRADPFPPLAAPPGLTLSETAELKAAAVAWVETVEKLRRAVQEPISVWERP